MYWWICRNWPFFTISCLYVSFYSCKIPSPHFKKNSRIEITPDYFRGYFIVRTYCYYYWNFPFCNSRFFIVVHILLRLMITVNFFYLLFFFHNLIIYWIFLFLFSWLDTRYYILNTVLLYLINWRSSGSYVKISKTINITFALLGIATHRKRCSQWQSEE